MNRVVQKYLKEYKHSRPIIFSHIEGQYPYEIFFDGVNEYGILFTKFNYHYAFGNVPSNYKSIINVLRDYQKKHNKEEMILYGSDRAWEEFLEGAFKEINGVADVRCLYYLNEKKFRVYDTHNQFVKLEECEENGSRRPYPQANTYIRGKRISYCRAFMIGDKQAELDVWTDEEHRKQGFAFDGCLVLIEELLNNNIIPNWSCWYEKESSKALADKLGFELYTKIKAFIWVKDFGEL